MLVTQTSKSLAHKNLSSDKKIQNPDDDDLYVPIQLHDKLVHHLEEDFVLINKKNKIIKLPAELNVVQILENFVRHFAANMTNTPIIGVRSDPVINEGVPGKFMTFPFQGWCL